MKLKAKTKGALLILFSAFSFAWMSTFVFLAGEIPVFPEGAVPEWSGAADCRKQHGGFQADIVCAAAMPAGIGVPGAVRKRVGILQFLCH